MHGEMLKAVMAVEEKIKRGDALTPEEQKLAREKKLRDPNICGKCGKPHGPNIDGFYGGPYSP